LSAIDPEMTSIESLYPSSHHPAAVMDHTVRVTEAISISDVFCFLVPALQFIQFQGAGVLAISDLILVAALPIAVLRHPERLRQKPMPAILTLGFLWLVSQIATDMWRNSAPEDFQRGWSKIFLLLVNITVLWIVGGRTRRRFVLYGIGLGLGTVLGVYINPSADSIIDPWKFGMGVPVSLLVVMWAAHLAKRRYLEIFIPLTALAIVHAFRNYRILALIVFITAIYSIFQMSQPSTQRQSGRFRWAVLGVTVACGVWVFTQVYSHYVDKGVFGEYAQRKLEFQKNGEGGLLLGGRGEILASGQAIIDSPILGHGSWARDSTYAAILADKRAEFGYKELYGRGAKRDDLIPTHSHIFGAWVDGGVAGGLFWLFVLGYTIHALVKVSGSEPLLPLFAFAGFMLVWDILFSPLGMPTRFMSPYFMVAMVVLRKFRDSQPVISEEA
jgi:hypothetical protein